MSRLLDLYCGAGGAARGYEWAGFDEIDGVDIKEQPHYPYRFILADALEYLAKHGHEYDAIHASPPCQGYSIMHNLPWLRDIEYPLLILPTLEILEVIGKPYVVENVMGARLGSKTLKKRGLEAHGLQAGWLCGAMFGLPFYRHRLFATNWLWLAPTHPKHDTAQGMPNAPRGRGAWEGKFEADHPGESKQATTFVDSAGRTRESDISFPEEKTIAAEAAGEDARGEAAWPGRRETPAGLNIRPGYETKAFNYPTIRPLGKLPDCRQDHGLVNGLGVGHTAGWRLAAAAMGIDWMNRDELTQAIPPAYTGFIGQYLLAVCG